MKPDSVDCNTGTCGDGGLAVCSTPLSLGGRTVKVQAMGREEFGYFSALVADRAPSVPKAGGGCTDIPATSRALNAKRHAESEIAITPRSSSARAATMHFWNKLSTAALMRLTVLASLDVIMLRLVAQWDVLLHPWFFLSIVTLDLGLYSVIVFAAPLNRRGRDDLGRARRHIGVNRVHRHRYLGVHERGSTGVPR